MSEYKAEDVKPSGEKLPRIDARAQSEIGEQIVRYNAELTRIKEEVSELKKDKTPYGMIMKSPVIFAGGLIIGAGTVIYMLCHELQERKELKKELIEYVDKMVIKARTSE